jgi:hypothetical protein
VGKAIWVSLLVLAILTVLILIGCYYKKKNNADIEEMKKEASSDKVHAD